MRIHAKHTHKIKIWDNKEISNSLSSVWDPDDGTTRKNKNKYNLI